MFFVVDKIKEKLQQKDHRNALIIKNISGSFIVRLISILVNFISVPLLLKFLGASNYGIWLTVSSFLGWFGMLDIGIGNGLRNKLTQSIALKDDQLSKIYVSTAYFSISVIMLIVILIFSTLFVFVDWTVVFNTPTSMYYELRWVVGISFSFMCIQMILKLITTIQFANQKSVIAETITMLSQLILLATIYALYKAYGSSSLLTIAIVYALIPVAFLFLTSLFFFNGRLKFLKPSFKHFNINYTKDILKLGGGFLLLQLAGVILYLSDNFLIAHFISTKDVVVYNAAYKYFSVILVGWSIVLTPFWSMITREYHLNNWDWIERSVKKLLVFWIFSLIIGVGMLFLANKVYLFWLDGAIHVPFLLSAAILLYVETTVLCYILSHFANGIGKIRIQIIVSVSGAIINIPLAIFFINKLHLGILGVPLATVVCVGANAFFLFIQYKKITKHTAKGVWNR